VNSTECVEVTKAAFCFAVAQIVHRVPQSSDLLSKDLC
jgi:hypothetical protein